MTDGNTHAIAQHLDEREDWDALQEVTAALEQAEARIEELEAKLAKATRFVRGFACRAKTQEHGPDEMGLIDLDTLRFQRDCDIVEARTTLAELTSSVAATKQGGNDE